MGPADKGLRRTTLAPEDTDTRTVQEPLGGEGRKIHTHKHLFELLIKLLFELQEAIRCLQLLWRRPLSSQMSLNDSKKKKVQVITSRGHVLATYESAREAARRTNIHHSQINHVCAKKESHAKGFVFRSADPQAELNQQNTC